MKYTSFLGAAMLALASLAVSSTALAQLSLHSSHPAPKDEAPPPKDEAPPPKDEAPAAKDADGSRHDNSVHVGVLGGVGFPRPLAVEAVLEFDHLVLLGGEYSALPTTNFSGVETSLWAVAADVRLFPMRNGFFVGLRAGKQHLGESATVTMSGFTASAGTTADTTFLNPRLGFLWNWHALALGIDAGVQIPIGVSTTSNLPPGVSAPSGAADLSHTLSQSVIPTVDLLRIGVVM